MRIRQLQKTDLDAAMALVRAANWNQCRADWGRLLALAPAGCYAGVVDGMVVATTTTVTYDDAVAWIGMVLVHPDHRGNGYGSQMFGHAVDALDSETAVGLDATDMGRPLYRRHDFRTAAPITRFTGILDPISEPDSVEPLTDGRVDALAAYDEVACGVDRRALVERLHVETNVVGLVHGDDSIQGYAFLRPGRGAWQLGPLVADTPGSLENLLSAAASRLDGDPVLVDVPEPGEVADNLKSAGLTADRRLERMTRQDEDPLLMGPRIIAAAGFEFG